jgi:hypothetical protein
MGDATEAKRIDGSAGPGGISMVEKMLLVYKALGY